MDVAVLVDAVREDDPPDRQDTLAEAAFVSEVLRSLGHEARRFEVDPYTPDWLGELMGWKPDVAFNLVETTARGAEGLGLVPAMLERLGIPVTGGTATSIAVTSDKAAAKALMDVEGIPTPPWLVVPPGTVCDPPFPGPYMVKPAAEDGSVGIGDWSVVKDGRKLQAAVERCSLLTGGAVLVERYIEGRELNLAALEGAAGPVWLPAAEIVFESWDPDRPRIVGYEAKWATGSFAAQHTVRRFPEAGDLPLDRILDLGLRCWRLFGIHGFARIDFRAGADGSLWVIEVNVNPCIAPDAGFMAAARHAGLKPEDVVSTLLERALAGRGGGHRGCREVPDARHGRGSGRRERSNVQGAGRAR